VLGDVHGDLDDLVSGLAILDQLDARMSCTSATSDSAAYVITSDPVKRRSVVGKEWARLARTGKRRSARSAWMR
jgi:hypothetical protein